MGTEVQRGTRLKAHCVKLRGCRARSLPRVLPRHCCLMLMCSSMHMSHPTFSLAHAEGLLHPSASPPVGVLRAAPGQWRCAGALHIRSLLSRGLDLGAVAKSTRLVYRTWCRPSVELRQRRLPPAAQHALPRMRGKLGSSWFESASVVSLHHQVPMLYRPRVASQRPLPHSASLTNSRPALRARPATGRCGSGSCC